MGKKTKKYDFSGYATKVGLKCSDGRTIMKDAFKHNDQQTVPLVWQHLHNDPDNILGHAVLENREDGVYTYGMFNDSEKAKSAKAAVAHGDITMLSIYANDLKEQGKNVLHGSIREVSLVLAAANPGAKIDNLCFSHSDGTSTEIEDEAIITTGLFLSHEKGEVDLDNDEDEDEDPPAPKVVEHAKKTDKTVQEVFDSLDEEQKSVVVAMIAHALAEGDSTDDNVEHSNLDSEEGEQLMKNNVFDQKDKTKDGKALPTLTHDQLKAISEDAVKCGSYKQAFLAHAVTYGIENIDYLFPDAKTITDSPDFVQRRMEWVTTVINGAKHSPFARIKSLSADITLTDARAKGYVKGNLKKEEFFALARRTTTPTTIYKKQKLDRDDIIDITDLDVVAWLKAEMRVMLDEELARAALISDGREIDDEDKIDETCIRPIAKDDTFYSHRVQVPANTTGLNLIDEILRNRTYYKGSGNPSLYTTEAILTDMLLVKDKLNRRIYNSVTELAAALRVDKIITVEPMEGVEDDVYGTLLCILVNMKDYTFGANKGGQVSMFDDFDIDYNQYKYLMEGRSCGALTKPKSALVFWRLSGILATPTAPTFDAGTNTITIPTSTGVTYSVDGETVEAGPLVITEDTTVDADADEGYYFTPGVTVSWTFDYTEA